MEVFLQMKKITRFLRFLILVFVLFITVTICFIFNKVLDQKINAGQKSYIEELSNGLEDSQ